MCHACTYTPRLIDDGTNMESPYGGNRNDLGWAGGISIWIQKNRNTSSEPYAKA
jgi:hypothetical protein